MGFLFLDLSFSVQCFLNHCQFSFGVIVLIILLRVTAFDYPLWHLKLFVMFTAATNIMFYVQGNVHQLGRTLSVDCVIIIYLKQKTNDIAYNGYINVREN